jgi:hypothetical protein
MIFNYRLLKNSLSNAASLRASAKEHEDIMFFRTRMLHIHQHKLTTTGGMHLPTS